MGLDKRHRDEDGAQDSEHIGLNEAHQHVEQEHEQGECHRENARSDTHTHTKEVSEDEDEQHQHTYEENIPYFSLSFHSQSYYYPSNIP